MSDEERTNPLGLFNYARHLSEDVLDAVVKAVEAVR